MPLSAPMEQKCHADFSLHMYRPSHALVLLLKQIGSLSLTWLLQEANLPLGSRDSWSDFALFVSLNGTFLGVFKRSAISCFLICHLDFEFLRNHSFMTFECLFQEGPPHLLVGVFTFWKSSVNFVFHPFLFTYACFGLPEIKRLFLCWWFTDLLLSSRLFSWVNLNFRQPSWRFTDGLLF